MSAFSVRFWGTRGSVPTPGPHTQVYGGNTSCVEVRCGGSIFILDAGTGIRELGNALMAEFRGRPIEADIFITHTHWDHIQGFPFFVPAYVPGNRFRLHGAHGMGMGFEQVFRGLMNPSYFPVDLGDMAAKLEFTEMTGGSLSRGEVRVETAFTNHPGVDMAYRLVAGGRSVTYLTDHENYQAMNQPTEFARKQDRAIEDFCRGTDLLICDSQYTDEEYEVKKTWGHSRYKDTVRLALDAEAKRLALFHHDPSHTDEMLRGVEAECRELARLSGKPTEAFLAREGLRLEL